MLFLAGTADAIILDGERIVASANTLLDSSISISNTLEDIRGRKGNRLLGRYAHTSGMTLKLTDTMFNLEYIAMNVGSDVTLGGDLIKNETLKVKNKKITLSETPVPMVGSVTKVYAFKKGTANNYQAYEVTGKEVSIDDIDDAEYCVRYMVNSAYATKIVVSSNFIPKTLSVILTANLYAGASCDISTSTLAGKLQIKVYRFMLNGNQELAMTSTGVAQTSLEGQCLSYGCDNCDGDGVYAEILQLLENAGDDMFASIIVEDADKTVAAKSTVAITVYACPVEGTPVRLNPDQYAITPDNTNFTDNKDGTITLTDGATSPFSVTVKAFGKEASANITIG